jgi:hypothetical protein
MNGKWTLTFYTRKHHENFESVLEVDANSQKELLRIGDEVERIWAAWALGLRFGKAVAPDLLSSLEKSPSPGTRRHLIVVLIGLGEKSSLEKFAVADPDPLVRATACRYLARILQPEDGQIREMLIHRLRSDTSPDVRLAILQEWNPRKFPLPPDLMDRLTTDPEPEVRELASFQKKGPESAPAS